MKTILMKVIDPNDQGVRENEILVSRIAGWYTRERNFYSPFREDSVCFSDYVGATTVVSLDSGAEYEIAESLESFRRRLRAIVDAPSYGFTGFRPMPPFVPKPSPAVCSSCYGTMHSLQLGFPNVSKVCDVVASDPSDKNIQICRDCLIRQVRTVYGEKR